MKENNGGRVMRTYENDTDLKIPKFYYKIPLRVLDFLCDIGLSINRLKPQKRKKNKSSVMNRNKRNVTFYL
jgi:hypothetical protein